MADADRRDWVDWHKPYDEPGSNLARRLAVVQRELRAALDERMGPVRLISMCAGQGRDVIPVLADYPRRDNVTALLVELDPTNAALAEASAHEAGLRGLRVLRGDAALTDNYRDAVPADVVMACGVFGNITGEDIERTVRALPQFCVRGATVLWTRGRRKDNDPTPSIRRWFREAGFEEIRFDAPDHPRYSVGVNRLLIDPPSFEPGATLFRFFR
jgi:hypothetical protein